MVCFEIDIFNIFYLLNLYVFRVFFKDIFDYI